MKIWKIEFGQSVLKKKKKFDILIDLLISEGKKNKNKNKREKVKIN